MATRRRLDAELVRRGLASSRTDAQAEVTAGRVLVNGAVADKPARLVAPGDAVLVTGPPPRFVGRGGEKLDAALTAFDLDVTGLRALDVGVVDRRLHRLPARRGVLRRVVALDVGHGPAAPTDPWRPTSRRARARERPRRHTSDDRADRRRRRRRRLVHLPDRDHPDARDAVPAWVSDGAAREAAVRGRTERGRQGQRGDHGPRRSTPEFATRSRRAGGRRLRRRLRGSIRPSSVATATVRCSSGPGPGGRPMTAVAVVAAPRAGGGGDPRQDGRRVVGSSVATRRGSCPTTRPVLDLGDLVDEPARDQCRAARLPRRRRHDAARRPPASTATTSRSSASTSAQLGYLTEIEPPDLTSALDRFFAGPRAGAHGSSTSA